jgi:hypothetical protein
MDQVSIEFSKDQWSYLAQCLNRDVQAQGLNSAKTALEIFEKIQESLRAVNNAKMQ